MDDRYQAQGDVSMRKRAFGLIAAMLMSTEMFTGLQATSAQAAKAPVKCHLAYRLDGWSAIYQHAVGSGHIACDNGQRASVLITMHGGGLTAGKFHVSGKGDISNVNDINDVFGNYAQAGASGGVVRIGTAQVLTKGAVSIALSGTGEGINLGVAVDQIAIQPAHP
jgi:hypothetical protein